MYSSSSTLGDRAFAVIGPRAWNSLPHFVTDCTSSIVLLTKIIILRLLSVIVQYSTEH